MSNRMKRNRRVFLKNAAYATGGLALLGQMRAPWASPEGYSNSKNYSGFAEVNHGSAVVRGEDIKMTISRQQKKIAGDIASPITINDISPGPLLRLREGQQVKIHVTNELPDSTSIHWHGFILPFNMDGVPGVSFPGIDPNFTFTYEFDIEQSGTYWYHSHSGLQEQLGHLGPVIIDPSDGDIGADR